MSMRFHYVIIPVAYAIVPLDGRWSRPRPLIRVTVIGPADSRLKMVLLDTGSDDTVFPEAWATQLGIDLTNAPTGSGTGVGSAAAAGTGSPGIQLKYAQVTLRLTDYREYREWSAWVGFTAAPLIYPILGFAGFLRYFTATFHGDREEVELTVNSLYPGT